MLYNSRLLFLFDLTIDKICSFEFLVCLMTYTHRLCLSISAVYVASLDNSGMKDVGAAAIWSTLLLLGNSLLVRTGIFRNAPQLCSIVTCS
jgi:hypothetical protein